MRVAGLFFWATAAIAGSVQQPCTVLPQGEVRYDESGSGKPAPWPPRETLPAPPAAGRLLPGTYWVRFAAVNPTGQPVPCVFHAGRFPPLAELFAPGSQEPAASTGWLLPLAQRAMANPQPVLPATLEPGVTWFYLRLFVPAHPLRLAEPGGVSGQTLAAFLQETRRFDHLNGIYGGIMLAVVLYNLFLFFSLRDRLHLLYVLYATAFGMIWLIRARMALVFLWPQAPIWDAQAHYYAIALAIVTGNAFTSAFLDLRQNAPALRRALLATSAAAVLLLALCAVQKFVWVENPLAFTALAACGLYVAAGIVRLRQGSVVARYFLLATGAVIVGTVAYTLTFFGVLPVTFLTANSAQLGSAAEMVLLAFALGHKIRTLLNEKDVAETESRTDALTGLANRRHWDELVDEEWRRAFRQGTTLAVMLVDVDHFKEFNDALGHQAGDELLRVLSEQLRGHCRRPGEVAARYGGEEFALLLPGLSGKQAGEVAARLREHIQASAWPHPSSPVAAVVTVSCGVAVAKPAEGVDPVSLVREADEALYLAKQLGRNQVCVRTASGTFPRAVGV